MTTHFAQQFAIGGNNGGQQIAIASSSRGPASRATKRRIRDRDRSPCERPRSRPSRREPSMPMTPMTTRFSVNRGRSATDEEILHETPVKRRKR